MREICGLFKIAGVSTEVIMHKLFSLSLEDKAMAWPRLLDDSHLLDWNKIEPLFYAKLAGLPAHLRG